MLTLLSPAKTQRFDAEPRTSRFTEPAFRDEAAELVAAVRTLSVEQLRDLMKTSDELARATHEDYRRWGSGTAGAGESGGRVRAVQAILVYSGEVYRALDAASLSARDLGWAQHHLRILSGLYGVLRPLDLIEPYRLEIATRLGFVGVGSLYDYWRDKLTAAIGEAATSRRARAIVNLASAEYSRAIARDRLPVRLITPVFRERGAKGLRTVSMYAKNARGRMARWIVENWMEDPDALATFSEDGYRLDTELSRVDEPVFVRDS